MDSFTFSLEQPAYLWAIEIIGFFLIIAFWIHKRNGVKA